MSLNEDEVPMPAPDDESDHEVPMPAPDDGSDHEEPKPASKRLTIKVASADGSELSFRVKPTTILGKVMTAYQKRRGVVPGSVRFTFDGVRVNPSDTPLSLEMQDLDVIDSMVEQTGGGKKRRKFKTDLRRALHDLIQSQRESVSSCKRDLVAAIDVTKDAIDEIFDSYDDGEYEGDEEFDFMDEANDLLNPDIGNFPTRVIEPAVASFGLGIEVSDSVYEGSDDEETRQDEEPVLDEEDESQEDEDPPVDPMSFDWDRVAALGPEDGDNNDDAVDDEGVALLAQLGQEEEEETPSIVRKRARDEQLSPTTPAHQAPDLSTAPPAPKRRRTNREGRYLKTYSSGYPDRSVTRRIVPLAKKDPYGTNILVLRDVYSEETEDDGVKSTSRGEIELDMHLFRGLFNDREYFERKAFGMGEELSRRARDSAIFDELVGTRPSPRNRAQFRSGTGRSGRRRRRGRN